jgi:CO/xanthine dehydrogenase FAD-binding subunit
MPLHRIYAHLRFGKKSMVSLSQFRVITPQTLAAALDALASGERIRPLAGGTDVMVQLEAGTLPPCTFLTIDHLRELRPPRNWPDGDVALPSLTTFRDLRISALKDRFPLLAIASREIGALAIQSRGTWVGNVANASPAADGVPALMAYDAQLDLQSKAERRRVALADFYRGYKQMDLRPDELITGILLPAPQSGYVEYFRKVGTRRFQAIAKTLLAARMRLTSDRRINDVRLVFASVAPFTLRARRTEAFLQGHHLTAELIDQACVAIQDEIRPIDDIRSTETYRRRVTANLLRDFLSSSAKNHNSPK